MFFSMLSLYMYIILLHGKRYAGSGLFISLTLLFHSQYFYLAVLAATLLVHGSIFGRKRLKILLITVSAAILLNGLWLISLGPNNYPDIQFGGVVSYIIIYTITIGRLMFLPWLVVVLLIVVLTRIKSGNSFLPLNVEFWEKLSLLLFFIIINILIFSIISPYPFLRYVAPVIPVIIVLIALLIDAAMKVNVVLAVVTAALLVVTNQFKDYLYEITHDYDGPIEGIVRYLNEHGSPDDIVAITYGDMPLKFYTKMKVIGGMTDEDLRPALDARWVIIRKNKVGKESRTLMYFKTRINLDSYRNIELDYPDISWENREEPDLHFFRTNTKEERVVIYKRID